ncbi:glycosyltransferase family 4 protein [Bacteroides fluxus]|uniref:Glycosyltransferase, group 1 family protein n=1 Tax=Bacteroides fluxus YIT 12057 TaxID=763034 RepID=F3PUJ0_9BACE|nr:glycosyltransferase family 4 protein [Bacteroides fluxus]EGF56061.1 glycosyltransferase, group 1 family protein [Bacteroides fluxus YIT 12057]
MEKRKKVLVLGEAFYPEDFLINDLVREWEKDGYQFEVLTRAPSYPFGKVYEGYKNKIYQTTCFNTIKIHRFPVLQGYEKSTIIKVLNYFSFVFWSCLIVLFIGKRFDRVFIYQTGPLTLATAGIFLKKLFNAKVTIWTQDLWPETVYAYGFKKTKLLSFCLDRFVKWIYKNCDSILVSCEGFIERIHHYTPEKDILFAPNWSLMEYKPTKKIELPGTYNFVFAGNVGKVQNLENVLRGFGQFVKDCPNACLNIIGDGSFLTELMDIAKNECIPNVNFTGRKPLSEMSDYYEAGDALIISLKDVPLYETMMPSKFQTYLATGKPIYAIFNGEVRNIVEKYQIGFGASPTDLGDIAAGFNHFVKLTDEEKKAIANNAACLCETVFNRKMIIKLIDGVVWK